MSTWDKHRSPTTYPQLDRNIDTEILIIGGGICGILTAYLLTKAGKKVVLIEKNSLANGATGATTAHITQVIDLSADQLTNLIGPQSAQQVWESGGQAIDLIESIITHEQLNCQFSRCTGYRFATQTNQLSELANENQALKQWHYPAQFQSQSNSNLGFQTAGYLAFPNQAKFHPLQFSDQLAQTITHLGGQIYEHTSAVEISNNQPLSAKTNQGNINAGQVIITTHLPFNNPPALFAKKALYLSYVIQAQIPHGLISFGLYWDLANPYYYFRLDPQNQTHDTIIFGGQDHRHELPSIKNKANQKLKAYLKQILPQDIEPKIIDSWSGPIIESSDGLPYIGRLNDHQLLATAFSGNGMTYSAIAAIIFRDIILNRTNHLIPIYDPLRPLSPSRLLKMIPHYTSIFLNGYLKTIFN